VLDYQLDAWLIVASTFDPTQQFYCHIETPPTFYTPIVSQSDYYTTVLADDAAKKLIAQQMSVTVLNCDFLLYRLVFVLRFYVNVF